MDIYQVKNMLTVGEVPADQLNGMISALNIEDLDALSELQKDGVREIISKALLMAKDPSSGVYIDDPEKAESLLSAIN